MPRTSKANKTIAPLCNLGSYRHLVRVIFTLLAKSIRESRTISKPSLTPSKHKIAEPEMTAHVIWTLSTLPSAAPALQSSLSALERDIAALESQSSGLEPGLGWFTLLVAIGVALEIFVVIHDHRKEVNEWRVCELIPEGPSLIKLGIEIASILLVIIGVMGEFGVGLKISSINGQLRAKGAELRSKSDQLLALVTQQASDADAGAAEANRQAAEANRKSEKERLARAKIEGAVAFRSLDDKQKRDIGTALAHFGSIMAASMWFANGSTEAELFADDIAQALRFAHIHTTTVGGIMEMREGGGNWDAPIESANTGVDISSTSNPIAQGLADALFKELTNRGFDSKRKPDQKSKNNPPGPVIWVTVQARPRGPQGEYKLQAEREAKAKKQQPQSSHTAK